MWINRKRLIQPHARHFPMSRCRILSRGMGRAFSIRPDWRIRRSQMFERGNIPQSQPNKIRKSERPRFGDVPQRIPSDISVILCVGKLTDSHAIKHDPDHSLKTTHDKTSSLCRGARSKPSLALRRLRRTLAQSELSARVTQLLIDRSLALLTIDRMAGILRKDPISCSFLNFSVLWCVLQCEEVCDGSKRHSPARFPCVSRTSHRDWRDFPILQLASGLRSMADSLDLLAAHIDLRRSRQNLGHLVAPPAPRRAHGSSNGPESRGYRLRDYSSPAPLAWAQPFALAREFRLRDAAPIAHRRSPECQVCARGSRYGRGRPEYQRGLQPSFGSRFRLSFFLPRATGGVFRLRIFGRASRF